MLYSSIVLDVAIFILSCFALNMAINAREELTCKQLFTQVFTYSISAVCFLRCIHIVAMVLFLFLCFPCFLCGDQCFAKKWLTSNAGVKRVIIANLESEWTWSHVAGEDRGCHSNHKIARRIANVKSCSICLMEFERG